MRVVTQPNLEPNLNWNLKLELEMKRASDEMMMSD